MVLERAKAIRFGDPQDPETQLGCVIHDQAAEMFEQRVLEVGAEQTRRQIEDGDTERCRSGTITAARFERR